MSTAKTGQTMETSRQAESRTLFIWISDRKLVGLLYSEMLDMQKRIANSPVSAVRYSVFIIRYFEAALMSATAFRNSSIVEAGPCTPITRSTGSFLVSSHFRK